MAQYRNPFDDSHVGPQTRNTRGPVTTRHREIETVRQKVQKTGVSANKGKFRPVYPEPRVQKDGSRVYPPYDPFTTTYAAPGGQEVVVVERDRPKVDPVTKEVQEPPASPHDRRMRVNGEVHSEPAAELLLKEKYGIDNGF